MFFPFHPNCLTSLNKFKNSSTNFTAFTPLSKILTFALILNRLKTRINSHLDFRSTNLTNLLNFLINREILTKKIHKILGKIAIS
jgi:hypothetical protein